MDIEGKIILIFLISTNGLFSIKRCGDVMNKRAILLEMIKH